jgi:NO-binding membrane sensor protein with MHYT domain/anti-sigma regulatory factor (Ser/Thr protein kinase)
MNIPANQTLPGSYDYGEVARSVLIAIAASYSSLDLAGRAAAAKGWALLTWLGGAATVMGIGIWAMHVKGMLAFHLPVPVRYHWPTLLAALLVAIIASALALYVTSQGKVGWVEASTGGVILGGGIVGLHYIAMAAMRLPAITRYSPVLVTFSVSLPILLSPVALLMAFDLREETRWTFPRTLANATVMGAAISAMHYTAMAAASFIPASPPDLSHTVNITPFGNNAIAAVTLIVLLTAMVTSLVDRRFHAHALQLAFAQANAELAYSGRAASLDELAVSIAHEINQPLGAVVNSSSASLRWLATDPPNFKEARDAAAQAVREANRAAEVIAGIRALLKKEPPRVESLVINEVIREVLALAGTEIAKARVTVKLDLSSGLPAVQGDRVQLRQVVFNLVVNAIEAMQAVQDGEKELRVETTPHSDGVKVSIQDTGLGLSDEDLDRIFHPFYTTKRGGIGMGLSISRSIIEAHGGQLRASSRPPRGAVFEFNLATEPGVE